MSDINVNATGALKPFDVKGNDKKITAEDIFEIVKDDKKKAAFKEAISDEIEASDKKPAKRAQLLELYYKVDTATTIKECEPIKKKTDLKELLDQDGRRRFIKLIQS